MSSEKQSEYMTDAMKQSAKLCEHGLEKSKCEKCSEHYEKDEESSKKHGEESAKNRKEFYKKRTEPMREYIKKDDESTEDDEQDEDSREKKHKLPVFRRTRKGLEKI